MVKVVWGDFRLAMAKTLLTKTKNIKDDIFET